MVHIMVDLEALDSARTAVVISLGAVKFDLETGMLGDTFYSEVSIAGIKDQLSKGRTQSVETLVWWMQQSPEAQKVFYPNNTKQSTIQLLEGFRRFCNITDCVWGNGVDYDNVVIRDLYETYNMPCPFTYRTNRCYRTYKAMFGNRAKLVREGAHHNGLDDAITQAKHLMAMHKAVHNKKPQ